MVKNTLAQKALDGSIGEAGDALFKGPVAIAYAPDPVSAAKVATQYAKDNDKFAVVGGFMGNDGAGREGAWALWPPCRRWTRSAASSSACCNAPATKIAGVLQAPAGQLARVVQRLRRQRRAA